MKKHDSNMLSANRGPITLKKTWANWLLSRMGMVKRKASTSKSKLTSEEFEAVKSQMLIDIKCTVCIEDILPALIMNWDQTAIDYVLQSSWTMAKSGSSRVVITHSPNHWSNVTTMEDYILSILVPYMAATREDLGLSPTH